LVVDVADSSVSRDRKIKKRVYVRAGTPAYWIVHLSEQQIEVYTNPIGPAEVPMFRLLPIHESGEQVPVLIDGIEGGTVAAAEILT